jgi:hypothetical protein
VHWYITKIFYFTLDRLRIGGKVVRTVKYSNEFALQGMGDILIETGRCYGKEMNGEELR